MDGARALERLLDARAAPRRSWPRAAPTSPGPSVRSGRYAASRSISPRRLDERVVGDPGHRGVAAAAVHGQPERRAHLLGGRAEVEHAPAELEPVAGALVERVLAANGVRDARGRATAGRSPRRPPRRRSRRRSGRRVGSKPSRASDAIATALAATCPFMSSAPRPQTWSSRSSPDHGIDLPLGGVGEHRVRVGEQQQPRTGSARDPRDEVRPVGNLGEQLAPHAVVLEVRAQELGRARLVPGRVDRVERGSARGGARPSRAAASRCALSDGSRARAGTAADAPLAVAVTVAGVEEVGPRAAQLLPPLVVERLRQHARRAVARREELPVLLAGAEPNRRDMLLEARARSRRPAARARAPRAPSRTACPHPPAAARAGTAPSA